MSAPRKVEAWDPGALEAAISSEILLDTRQILDGKGAASWLAAAGRDGEAVFRGICKNPMLQGVDVSKVSLFLADERFSKDPKDLNFGALSPYFDVLKGWGMKNIYGFPQMQTPKESALAYGKILDRAGCDLAWLSCGADGHVAGIFPSASLKPGEVVWDDNSPKPPKRRMSVGMDYVRKSGEIFVVAIQPEKAPAMKSAQSSFANPRLPVTFCQGRLKSKWYVSSLIGRQIF